MSWSTIAQALTWTGKELTQEDLDVAAGIVDIHAGITEDAPEDAILARDRRWLAMANAYQAAWMKPKPGLLDHRESHTSTSADGVSVQREAPSDIYLAPLAARVLKNLSWIGQRTVQTLPHAVRAKGSFLNEAADELNAWTPRPIA